MLCQALLTVVAVSCTFSREVTAHDSGTQPIVQIKDLLCVLWLSGIQKEDLDVNMLTKLHRHNVSIENMNNQTMRQACTYQGSMNGLNITQNAGAATIKTSRSINDRQHIGHQNISDNKVNHHTQIIPTYLNNNGNNEKNQDVEKKLKQTNQQIETPIILQRTTYQGGNSDYSVNPIRNLAQETTVTPDNEPDIQNIMKFWQKLASNMPKNPSVKKVSPEPITDTTLAHSTSQPDVNIGRTQSMEDMIRLVAEYISKSGTTTTKAPIARDDDLKTMYSNLIVNMNKKNAPIVKTLSDTIDKTMNVDLNKDNVRLNLLKNNMTPDTRNLIYQSPVFVPDTVITENLKPQNSGSFEHILKLHNQYKIYAPIYLYHNNFSHIAYKVVSYKNANRTDPFVRYPIRRYLPNRSEPHQTSEDDISENINANKMYQNPGPEVNLSDNLKIDRINQEPSPIISKDVLREIANTVRDYILKDLKKELATNTLYISTTPTPIFSVTTRTVPTTTTLRTTTGRTATPTTTSKIAVHNTSKTPLFSLSELTQIPNLSNMTDETKQVLDGFLKLFFEKVKAVHKTTIITHDANYKMTNTHHEYFNVTNNVEPLETPIKTRRTEVQKGENFVLPNLIRHPLRPSLFDYTPQERAQLKNVGQVSIIQTNSNEIAPIGVPLVKPWNRVHHVEVVTTDFRDDSRARPEVPAINGNHYQNAPYDNGYNRYEYPDYASSSLNNRDRYYKRSGYDYKQNYKVVGGPRIPQRRYTGYDNNYNEMYANRYPPKVVDDNVNPKLTNSFNELFNRRSSDKSKQAALNDQSKQQKNRVKFHEKLEKVTDSLSVSEEKQNANKQQFKQQFKVQVASRQQMPLNGMKKGYGDEHFKNYLKTQQKVNDMLERILSTKSKPDTDLPLIDTA